MNLTDLIFSWSGLSFGIIALVTVITWKFLHETQPTKWHAKTAVLALGVMAALVNLVASYSTRESINEADPLARIAATRAHVFSLPPASMSDLGREIARIRPGTVSINCAADFELVCTGLWKTFQAHGWRVVGDPNSATFWGDSEAAPIYGAGAWYTDPQYAGLAKTIVDHLSSAGFDTKLSSESKSTTQYGPHFDLQINLRALAIR